jgi:phosphopentomutase
MKEEDLLIITADHGCDPTTPSTDHSREYIPVLLYGPIKSCNIGTRTSFADIGATIAEVLKLKKIESGNSFYDVISK